MKSLEEKYGVGYVNLQEGTFESSKEETKTEEESAE